MNKTTEALKLAEEAQTPLKDLLRAVPKDGSDLYEEDKFCHHNIPYGRLIHEALAEIERLEVLAKPEITTPDVCGEVCARAKLCYGCGKAFDEANAKLADHSGDANEMVYSKPSVFDGVCCGCSKKAADGWALYCVECWEKSNGDPFAASGKPIDHIPDATKMVCNWRQPTYDDAECNAWQADCDQYWAITEGTPTENGMKFCHGCGKPIKEHPFVELEDEE